MKKTWFPLAFTCVIASTFIGCTNGSGFVNALSLSSTAHTITGRAMAGPVSGGTVKVYDLHADGTRGAIVISSTTDNNGNFAADLGSFDGPAEVVITGGSYLEESTGNSVALGGNEISAVLPSVGAGQTVAVTPLTHIAAQRAISLIGAGATRATAIASANMAMAQAAGLTGVSDITSVLPANPSVGLATQGISAGSNEAKYGLFVAAISQYGTSHGGVNSIAVMNAFATDFLNDGQLDGEDQGAPITVAGGQALSASTWGAELTSAQTDYIANPLNSGIFDAVSGAAPNSAPNATCTAIAGHPICSFGAAGTVTNTFGLDTEIGAAIAKQADGKIINMGYLSDSSNFFDSGRVVVTRLLANGEVDTSFGVNGKYISPVDTNNWLDGNWVGGLAIQSDGKIVVSIGNQGLTVIRLLPDGTLDSTFGVGGIYQNVNIGRANQIAIQGDGKILVATTNFTATNGNYGVARLTTSGTLDASFGTAGVAGFESALMPGSNMACQQILLQADGKILVSGKLISTGAMPQIGFEMARLNTDGSLDTGFANGGLASTDFGHVGAGYPMGIVVNGDGSILIAGSAPGASSIFIERYSSAGVLDATFGTAGVFSTGIIGTYGLLAAQADGKIIFVIDGTVHRYMSDASVDASWGVRPISVELPEAVLVTSDAILVSGSKMTVDSIMAAGIYQ